MNDENNRRAAQRHRVYKGGRIFFNEGRSTIDCLVRNLSESGARLDVTSSVGVPQSFLLSIAGVEGMKQCTVAWRTLKQIGVAFGTPGDEAG